MKMVLSRSQADDFLASGIIKEGDFVIYTPLPRAGPNDLFEISSNNSPDPENDEEEVIEPQDYTGDYPLEGENGDDDGHL